MDVLEQMREAACHAYMTSRGENGAPITNPLNPDFSPEKLTAYLIDVALSAAERAGYALRATGED